MSRSGNGVEKASFSLVEIDHRPRWRQKEMCFQMNPHSFRPGLTETAETSSTFCRSSLPPRAGAARPGRATQVAIDSKSLAAKQTKGSSIILAVLARRPPSLLSPPSSPLLSLLLSSTHLWRSPVKRKLWGRHGALCTAGLAPLLRGRGPGLIGGSTREPSNRQANQPGGPFASM